MHDSTALAVSLDLALDLALDLRMTHLDATQRGIVLGT
jgi:hypothetical protein